MKQYYAVTFAYNPESYITKGKRYPVTLTPGEPSKLYGRSFYLISDNGDTSYCLERGCAHLNGGSWVLVEITLWRKLLMTAKRVITWKKKQ